MRKGEIEERVKHWVPLSEEPVRQPMGRGVRFPTPATELLSIKQELTRVRAALRESIALNRVLAEDDQVRG